MPYTVVFSGEHRYVREHLDIEPMSREEYFAAVKQAAGMCDCGGKLSFEALARCPKCGSARIVEGDVVAFYD